MARGAAGGPRARARRGTRRGGDRAARPLCRPGPRLGRARQPDRRAEPAEALADEHLADALALLPQLPAASFRFIDVGSGAGLPGLVLALLRPDAEGMLLEPTRKKRAFLAHAVRALALAPRVEARAERLEAHLAAGAAGRYDVAVSRATWPAAHWLELGRPLVRPGGCVLGLEGAESWRAPGGSDSPCVPHRGSASGGRQAPGLIPARAVVTPFAESAHCALRLLFHVEHTRGRLSARVVSTARSPGPWGLL